jgi:transposase-like protein
MTISHTTIWLGWCRACGTTETMDPVLPLDIETGLTCPQCGAAELIVTETGPAAGLTVFPAQVPPDQGWQCCHCGGTCLDFYGDVCEHCEGTGRC